MRGSTEHRFSTRLDNATQRVRANSKGIDAEDQAASLGENRNKASDGNNDDGCV